MKKVYFAFLILASIVEASSQKEPIYRLDFESESGFEFPFSTGILADSLAMMRGAELVKHDSSIHSGGFCLKLSAFDQYAVIRRSVLAMENEGMLSFTLGAWVKIGEINTQAFIFGQGNLGVSLNVSEAGIPVLVINRRQIAATRKCVVDRDVWTFLAVSYDGSTSEDNVKFYVATGAGSAEKGACAVLSVDHKPFEPTEQTFRVGPNWIGLADSLRFYASNEDSDGALDSRQIYEWMRETGAKFETQ